MPNQFGNIRALYRGIRSAYNLIKPKYEAIKRMSNWKAFKINQFSVSKSSKWLST
jgi:hypothetical protein